MKGIHTHVVYASLIVLVALAVHLSRAHTETTANVSELMTRVSALEDGARKADLVQDFPEPASFIQTKVSAIGVDDQTESGQGPSHVSFEGDAIQSLDHPSKHVC